MISKNGLDYSAGMFSFKKGNASIYVGKINEKDQTATTTYIAEGPLPLNFLDMANDVDVMCEKYK